MAKCLYQIPLDFALSVVLMRRGGIFNLLQKTKKLTTNGYREAEGQNLNKEELIEDLENEKQELE